MLLALVACVTNDDVSDVTDRDGDGFDSVQFDGTDCDDSDPAVNPGVDEVCADGVDNDCDGAVDDEGTGAVIWYPDADEDGYGSPTGADPVSACVAPTGYVDNRDDCNDLDGDIHPNAPEVCDDIDNDCSGDADDGLPFFDAYLDTDEDGYGDEAGDPLNVCELPPGYADNGEDCNDSRADIHPNVSDPCDVVDNDCDDMIDEDLAGAAEQCPAASCAQLGPLVTPPNGDRWLDPEGDGGAFQAACDADGFMRITLDEADALGWLALATSPTEAELDARNVDLLATDNAQAGISASLFQSTVQLGGIYVQGSGFRTDLCIFGTSSAEIALPVSFTEWKGGFQVDSNRFPPEEDDDLSPGTSFGVAPVDALVAAGADCSGAFRWGTDAMWSSTGGEFGLDFLTALQPRPFAWVTESVPTSTSLRWDYTGSSRFSAGENPERLILSDVEIWVR